MANGQGGKREGAGRPARNLYDIIDVRQNKDGTETQITVMDRVEEALRLGGFLHDAAARIGVTIETLRDWRRQGVKADLDVLNGRRHEGDVSPKERQYIELARRMEKAETEARLELLATARQLGRGGIPTVKTITRKIPARGNRRATTETVEEVATTLPDSAMIRWLLSHRWPNDFAGRVELTGPEGGPIVHDAISALDKLRAAIGEIAPPAEAATGNGQH